jgi:outer membrane protein OmpA-like peptidoglycan-associated protein
MGDGMMMKSALGAAALGTAMMMATTSAHAQASPRSPLLDLPQSQLRGELETRYQSALAATLAPDVKRSEDVRYIWASEAKVQCGIAIGYLKTRTVDADSINKCDAFTARLSQVPPPPAPPLPPPQPPEPACSVPPVVSVFFDWDVDVPPADARSTLEQVVQSRAMCGWRRIEVIGHTDRSGTDGYNLGLSNRRANNVAALLEAAGVPRGELAITGRGESQLKVETLDGVREPMNRRVEIVTVGSGQ